MLIFNLEYKKLSSYFQVNVNVALIAQVIRVIGTSFGRNSVLVDGLSNYEVKKSVTFNEEVFTNM